MAKTDKIFSRFRKYLKEKDDKREKVIIRSRDIAKSSKQAIYSLHRGNIKDAENILEAASKTIISLKGENPLDVGAYNAALQEYAEAKTYHSFIVSGDLPDPETMGIEVENYLLGICDLTGELARRAVYSVVNEDMEEIGKIHSFVQEIYEEFLKFDLRNGELRKKSDSIKWNLKKIEEIMYDLKIRGKI